MDTHQIQIKQVRTYSHYASMLSTTRILTNKRLLW